MRQYEITVLIHPDLEMNIQPALDKIEGIIKTANGNITKNIDEGKKRLAYRVKGQDFALYHYYEAEIHGQNIAEIERALSLDEEVLRSLIVSVDPKKVQYEEKKKLRETKDKQLEEAATTDEESKTSSEELKTGEDELNEERN
ncbi:MAG: 30S ribosomal protein S6 [Candidatus Saccharibacteria bacterium]|nr:30S ribosomal protein S6 [Candidatus Saccharibacteria bacterium]